jgi:hypothetical protein
MKYSLILTVPAFALAVVACGSSNPPASDPTTTTGSSASSANNEKHGGEHGKQGEDHHKDLAPPLKEFHHVLAPVWHTDPGPGRVEKACANVKAMSEKAAATNDAELVANVKDLDAACAKDGKAEVETKLGVVHERFHAVAKIEKHEKH